MYIYIYIWRFPKIWVPPSHPFPDGDFPSNIHPAIGVPPISGNPQGIRPDSGTPPLEGSVSMPQKASSLWCRRMRMKPRRPEKFPWLWLLNTWWMVLWSIYWKKSGRKSMSKNWYIESWEPNFVGPIYGAFCAPHPHWPLTSESQSPGNPANFSKPSRVGREALPSARPPASTASVWHAFGIEGRDGSTQWACARWRKLRPDRRLWQSGRISEGDNHA